MAFRTLYRPSALNGLGRTPKNLGAWRLSHWAKRNEKSRRSLLRFVSPATCSTPILGDAWRSLGDGFFRLKSVFHRILSFHKFTWKIWKRFFNVWFTASNFQPKFTNRHCTLHTIFNLRHPHSQASFFKIFTKSVAQSYMVLCNNALKNSRLFPLAHHTKE